MFSKKQTVDGIVSDFRRTIDRLRECAGNHAAATDKRLEQIAQLCAANHDAQQEHARATAIANRIEEIIG